jgi:hypothetical protein
MDVWIQYRDKSTKDDIRRQGVIQNRWLLEYLRLVVTYLG